MRSLKISEDVPFYFALQAPFGMTPSKPTAYFGAALAILDRILPKLQ